MRYLLILFFSISTIILADLPVIYPPRLQKGDNVGIVFPASYLDKDKEALEIINKRMEWLKEQGFRPILFPAKVKVNGYLAGTDKERAEALMKAWKDPGVKAIWCFRGGYGTPRMLDLLDYEYIKSNPKIFIGMSDITALHQAIQQTTGLVTFLSPVLNYYEEKDTDFDVHYALSDFDKILLRQKSGEIPLPNAGTGLRVIVQGKAKGKLVGGNLSLVAAMCGTKWQINTENKILVLEDVGEEIFRIDRMLWQLDEAGLLEKPAAVILGSWFNCKSALQNSLTLTEVFAHYFKNRKYPVIVGFPTGHDKYQATLPLNAFVEIDTQKKSVKLLQPATK